MHRGIIFLTHTGAMPIFGAVYDDEPLPLIANGSTCAGNESSLLDCPGGFVLIDPPQLINENIFNIVGVRCDGECILCKQ